MLRIALALFTLSLSACAPAPARSNGDAAPRSADRVAAAPPPSVQPVTAAPPPSVQIVLGDSLFADGPRAFPVGVDSVAARPDLAPAAAERKAAATAMPEIRGTESVVLPMFFDRVTYPGRDRLRLQRASDGRIRFAVYLAEAHETEKDIRLRHGIRMTHLFDASGRIAQVELSSRYGRATVCGGGLVVNNWEATFGTDGQVLAFERRDAVYVPTEPTIPPEACGAPSAFAPTLMYPTIESMLEGLGVPPPDELDWQPPQTSFPAPPPPPRRPPQPLVPRTPRG